MRPLPADPAGRHARLIAAFCEDLADPAFALTGEAPRAAAMAAISRGRPASVRRLPAGDPETGLAPLPLALPAAVPPST
jgi:hypothetical protein